MTVAAATSPTARSATDGPGPPDTRETSATTAVAAMVAKVTAWPRLTRERALNWGGSGWTAVGVGVTHASAGAGAGGAWCTVVPSSHLVGRVTADLQRMRAVAARPGQAIVRS